MTLARSVAVSFSFPVAELTNLEEFDKLAEREGKDRSKMIQEFIRRYVKEHANNPVPKLDKFADPEFSAWPTIAERPEQKHGFFDDLPTKELFKFMNHSEEWKLAAQKVLRQRGELR